MACPELHIPSSFRRTMGELYGDAGLEWIEGLPARVAGLARDWGLAVGVPFEPLSYNYVAPAVREDGSSAVLKVGFPARELMTEIAALALFDGRGMVRLLALDRNRGAMLLERLEPGTALTYLGDEERAMTIAVGLMRRYWQPMPGEHPFPTVADWAAGFGRMRERFGGGTGPLPAERVAAAEGLFEELLASAGLPALLHGDLHHGNVLAAEREPWLGIDPKGLVGEPAYDVAVMLRDNMGPVLSAADPRAAMRRRIDQLADESGFDRERLRAWAEAQAVLSAWWSVEDHGYGWEEATACAELLSRCRDRGAR